MIKKTAEPIEYGALYQKKIEYGAQNAQERAET